MNKRFKYIITLLLSIMLIAFVSCPDGSTNIASFKDYKHFEFQREVEIDPSSTSNTFVIALNGYKFSDAVTSGASVLSDGLSWITSPADTGLKFNITSINADKTEATIAITSTPTRVLNGANIEGEIAKEHLVDENGNQPSSASIINTKASKITIKSAGPASLYTEKLSIAGEKGEKLDDFYEFTINAKNVSFNAMTASSLDISKWFTDNEDVGLKFALKENVSANAKTLTVSVTSEGLTKAYTGDFKITVPGDLLSVGGNLAVDTNGSTIDISDTKPTWKLYDLASFGTIDLQMKSPNYNLTKNEDGTDIAFKGTLIAKGSDNTVKYEKGLSRRGYKLKGFAVPGGDGNIDINNVTYPVATNDITKGFTVTTTPNAITKVYAVWEVDPEAWGWTAKEDGTYQKTYDISGYNETTGENAFFPATFNLKKSGISEADQANYQDYPYYREAKILSKGMKVPGVRHAASNNFYDLDDILLDYDFAIGEQVVTGYMLDVLRTWNNGTKGDGSDAKGYDIPSETLTDIDSTSTANVVGYGSSVSGSLYTPNNEKADPITYISIPQTIVISNALTAYYNEKNINTPNFVALTPVYEYENAEIKTIENANALLSTVLSSGDVIADVTKTGFRLPTLLEWKIAARIVPESNYEKSLTGAHMGEKVAFVRNYMYPQITRSNMYSGATEIEETVTTASTLADKYAWFFYSNGIVSKTTHGFLKKSNDSAQQQNWTVLDRTPNNIGVYGMSGNVMELCDTRVSATPEIYRVCGGSFATTANGIYIGYNFTVKMSSHTAFVGFRLARTL